MKLWNVVLWLVATVLAVINVVLNEQNGLWILITVLFAINAVRAFVIYNRERKEKNDG